MEISTAEPGHPLKREDPGSQDLPAAVDDVDDATLSQGCGTAAADEYLEKSSRDI